MRKLKYTGILIVPIAAFISFNTTGISTFLPLMIAFIFVPLFELFLKPDNSNLTKLQADILKDDSFFSILLYAIVPIQLFLLIYFLKTTSSNLPLFDLIGRISSMGIMCGVFGINVGHELGHRTKRWEQFLGEILLLTSLETHFLPYHNTGHHFNVATPNDPATARKNEWLFTFWFRSQIGSYLQAWQLEAKKLNIKKKAFFSIYNRMLFYTIAQIGLCFIIYTFFGITTFTYFLIAAGIGILLLETVNYIEHYGLSKTRKESGRYEVVNPKHSWNSDHILGRILLFELSRHSDHHHRAHKPYQVLDSYKDAPQMITGYPGMLYLALIPPLWFNVMNKRLPN